MIKKVSFCYYTHVSNLQELLQILTETQKKRLIEVLKTNILHNICNELDAPYTSCCAVIKYNTKVNSVSLIESHDWDVANEPTVGDSYCYKVDGSVKVIKGGNKVYHNKWQFVSEDYDGFDVEDSQRRTEEWNRIYGIKELKKKIGSKKYWHKLLKDNNISI